MYFRSVLRFFSIVLFVGFAQAQMDIQKFFIRPADSPNASVKISYLFSFQCKGCADLFALLKADLAELSADMAFYPLIKNNQGKILVKAYLVGKKHQAPLSFYENLYQLAQQSYREKDCVEQLKTLADLSENAWNTVSYYEVQAYIEQSVRFAKENHVKQIPSLYIEGPLGVYCLSPTEDLKIQDIPALLNYIFSLQNQEKKKRYVEYAF